MSVKPATETPSITSQAGKLFWQGTKWTAGCVTRAVTITGGISLGSHLAKHAIIGAYRRHPASLHISQFIGNSVEQTIRVTRNTFQGSYIGQFLNIPYIDTLIGNYSASIADDMIQWLAGSAGLLVGWAVGNTICWTANKTTEVVQFVVSRALSSAEETPAISKEEQEKIREARTQKFASEPPKASNPLLKGKGPLRIVLAKDSKLD